MGALRQLLRRRGETAPGSGRRQKGRRHGQDFGAPSRYRQSIATLRPPSPTRMDESVAAQHEAGCFVFVTRAGLSWYVSADTLKAARARLEQALTHVRSPTLADFVRQGRAV